MGEPYAPDKPVLKLVGTDGNAFAILAAASRAARAAGKDEAWLQAFRAAATSGDYDHLLAVCMEWFEVE